MISGEAVLRAAIMLMQLLVHWIERGGRPRPGLLPRPEPGGLVGEAAAVGSD